MGLARSTIQPPFDIDAQRFIYATGITNFNQKRAINYLVKGLKQNNLWSKMAAVYPMVGGTAFTCKFNLVNPRDSDLAFRLTFFANPIFSYQGVKWNGTTQYADTNLVASTSNIITLNSSHVSYYSRTNILEASYDIAVTDAISSPTRYSYIAARFTGNLFFVANNSASTVNVSTANSDGSGFFISTRVSSTQIVGYRNNTTSFTGADTSSGLPAFSFYLAARNQNGAASGFSATQCAFASIGSGLSATDAFNFNSIVQQFQIILQRNV